MNKNDDRNHNANVGEMDVTIHKTDLQHLVDRMVQQIQRQQHSEAEQYFAHHKHLGDGDD